MSYVHCPSSGMSKKVLAVQTSNVCVLYWRLYNLAVKMQVEVPTSGSETVECGLCQHAFLVSAN
jgi:hypothetical protein